MELHGLLGACVCVLSDLGRIGGWNYEERWSRIDGEELAMAANGGNRIKQNAEGSGGFGRKPMDIWWALESGEKEDQEDQEQQQVRM
jgi:hypothetical protein